MIALLFVMLSLYTQTAQATHFAAADMYVTYHGKNPDGCGEPEYKYVVTLILYGACEPFSADIGSFQPDVNYESLNSGLGLQSVAITNVLDEATGTPVPAGYNGDIVHGLCDNYANLNACLIPSNLDTFPAFRKWIFISDTITNMTPQTDWRFWWSSSARNNSIANLAAPGTFYVECGLNNAAQYDVSTPRFGSDPLPTLCVNVLNTFRNDPIDPNKRDTTISLRTFNKSPLGNAGAPYGYQTGYSLVNPIGSVTPYTVSPVSGVATFTPSATGFFVLAFGLEKVQNEGTPDEVILAYTMRDVQVSVLSCTREAPKVQSTQPIDLTNATFHTTGNGDSAIYVCPGNELRFTVNANTGYQGHTLYITSNNDYILPGSTLTKSGEGTQDVSATLSWTPTVNDIGDYAVTISPNDSTCSTTQPIVLRHPIVYNIRVTNGLDAGPDQKFCQFNEKQSRQLYVDGTYGQLRVNWSDISGGAPVGINDVNSTSPVALLPQGAEELSYVVTTPDLIGTCKNKDTVVLGVDRNISVEIIPFDSNYVMCTPEYLQLEARLNGEPALRNLQCGVNNGFNLNLPDTVVEVFGSPSLVKGRFFDDSLRIETPSFANSVKTAKHQFFITKDDMAAYGMVPSTLRSIILDIFEAKEPDYEYSNFSIAIKCTPKRAFKNNAFETGLTTVYQATAPIKIIQGTNEFVFDKPYDWDSTQNLVIQICYNNNVGKAGFGTVLPCDPPLMKYVPTSYQSRLSYYPLTTDPATNKKIPDSTVTDVCGVNFSNDARAFFTRPAIAFRATDAPFDGVPFKWHGQLLSDSLIQQPLAYVPKTARFVVESFGNNGCRIFDTLNVYVPKHDFKVIPADSSICFGTNAIMSVQGGNYFKWYEYNDEDDSYVLAKSLDCNTCRTVRAAPLKSTHYRVGVYDSVFCIDTIDAWVKVLPKPEVKLLTRDTVIKYGRSIQLLATGARQYNWIPSGSLSSPNTSAPLATPTEPTSYVVTGIGANGCRSFDTVKVDIDYRDNIMVPTAFSPNGDGKNDMFRVANLTFQRIMEFRVFNRWGQEIFSTTDSRTGWDGNWKGEEQPVDNYKYIIRVGFPDGLVETYKGDVTLIR